MRYAAGRAAQPDDVPAAPTRCPACRSGDVKTADKVVDASTYWRCGGCGEIWNVGRQRPANAYSFRPYGR